MHIFRIPKKSGGERLIYAPSRKEKRELRSLVDAIERKARAAAPEGVLHGFTIGRSPVTNAMAHIGRQFTTCMDLSDFFDSVTAGHLEGKLGAEEIEKVIVDGATRQGLPTSPAAANLAAADMDRAILQWRDRDGLDFVYTRYADDLSFSYDDPGLIKRIIAQVEAIAGTFGFAINPKKTRTMWARRGRRTITGVAVDEERAHPPREVKRRLRAARHQNNQYQAAGLAEWCRLKLPRERGEADRSRMRSDIDRLRQHWKVRRLPLEKLPVKSPDEVLGPEFLVTGDPVYMLGIGHWVQNTPSRLEYPNGFLCAHLPALLFMKGIRLACHIQGGAPIRTIAGVSRTAVSSCAFVYELHGGLRTFDTLAACPASEQLITALMGAGYLPYGHAYQALQGAPRLHRRVIGHVPKHWKILADSFARSHDRAQTGPWAGREVQYLDLFQSSG